MVLDIGIRAINQGTVLTNLIYQTGYRILYGVPKTDAEILRDLVIQVQELQSEIIYLKSTINHMQTCI